MSQTQTLWTVLIIMLNLKIYTCKKNPNSFVVKDENIMIRKTYPDGSHSGRKNSTCTKHSDKGFRTTSVAIQQILTITHTGQF